VLDTPKLSNGQKQINASLAAVLIYFMAGATGMMKK